MYNIIGKLKGEKIVTAGTEVKTSVTDGFFRVAPSLWKHIPAGSIIQYVRIQKKGESLERDERWHSPGFVKQYNIDLNGKHKFLMSVCRYSNGDKKEYGVYAVDCDNIEELWKKCSKDSCIEVYLINATLAKQKKQISKLTIQIQELTKRLDTFAPVVKSSLSAI